MHDSESSADPASEAASKSVPASNVRRAGVSLRAVVFVGLILAGAAGVVALFLRQRPPTNGTPSRGETHVVSRLPRPAPAADGFLGSEACTECHSQIARRYAGHPMAVSLTALHEAPAIEDYERNVRFAPTPRREYWIERRDENVFHHDLVQGLDGETLADQGAQVSFIVGSGKRGRSYLIRRDAFLFMSPVSWYTAQQRWDLSPQYPAEHHQGFERPASDRCLQCHAGRLNYAAPPTTELALPYAPEPFAEKSIGCERCHGPGQAHVEYRRSLRTTGNSERATSDRTSDPIVNPAKLDIERRDAVCNQCHLQGDAVVLRYGRLHGDFRPGDHLGDIWSVFVSDTGVEGMDATRAVSQVEQVRTSRCFLESKSKLSCTSCHDPHEVPAAESTASYYEAKCNACHAERGCRLPASRRTADPTRRDCIACHMPRLGASDVPHAVQTDHRILREPARGVPAVSPTEEPEPRIFDLAVCELSPVELDRAWGIRMAQIAEASRSVELAHEAQARLLRARSAVPDDIELLDALAVTYMLQQRPDEAAEIWRSVLAIDPRRHSALFTLTVLLQNSGKNRESLVYLEKLLAINPWLADIHLRHSQVLAKLGKMAEATQAAQRAQELAPSRPESYAWLQSLYRQQGNAAEVRRLDQILGQLRSPKGQSANE